MIKFLLVSLLACTSIAALTGNQCMPNLLKTIGSFKKAVMMDISNDKIDALTNFIN